MLADFSGDFSQNRIRNLALISIADKSGALATSCAQAAKEIGGTAPEELRQRMDKVEHIRFTLIKWIIC